MRQESQRIEGIVGAVLAGGASRRLGRDKALIEFEGRTLLERAVSVLGAVFDEVVIVGTRRSIDPRLEATRVPDIQPGQGPVGGLHAALVHAAGLPVFLLACDMPYVTREVVQSIVGDGTFELEGRECPAPAARVIRDAAGPQPLCGLYSGGCLQPVEEALEHHRRSARALLERLRTEYLTIDDAVRSESPRVLTSINTPEDLQRLAASRSRSS